MKRRRTNEPDPMAEVVQTLRAMARERGIEPCHQYDCEYVATWRVHWLGQLLPYCDRHAARLDHFAVVGFGFGMPPPRTRIPPPEKPGISKRFRAIGLDLLGELNNDCDG